MDPNAFLEFSRELHNLTQNPSVGFSQNFVSTPPYPEIVYRTMANRSYYYIFHSIREHLEKLIFSNNVLLNSISKSPLLTYHCRHQVDTKKVSEWIKVTFKHHANILRLYDEINRRTKDPKLQALAKTIYDSIKGYKVVREAADYDIQTATPSLPDIPFIPIHSINFQSPSSKMVDYLIKDIRMTTSGIIQDTETLFSTIIDNDPIILEDITSELILVYLKTTGTKC